MFRFKSAVVLGLFSVHLALEISPGEEVTGVVIGRSCSPFNIPSSWDHVSWNILLRTCIVSHCPALLKPESLGFNTKSLQIRFQKRTKHLSLARWIYCYCPACLVFKETGTDHPERCYTTPNNNLLRIYRFLVNIMRVLGCPVATVLRIDIVTKMKICFIRHENVVKVIVIQTIQQNVTKSFSIYSVLIIYCLKNNHFVQMEIQVLIQHSVHRTIRHS